MTNGGEISKLRNSLWIIFSIIPFLNGIGFIYIGSKTSEEKWVKRGILYEIPWMLFWFFSVFQNEAIISFFTIIGFLSMAVSICDSVKTNSSYFNIIKNSRYKIPRSRIKCLLGIIICMVPFLNGLVYIYLGRKISEKTTKYEGIIYVCLWFLGLFTVLLSPFLLYVSMVLNIVSVIRFIQIIFKNNKLYFIKNNYDAVKKEEKTTKSSPAVEINRFNFNTTNFNTPQENIVSKNPFTHYEDELNDLQKSFDEKEETAHNLVENRFSSSKITYERFMSIIEKSHENFYKQKNSILKLIETTSEPNVKIENYIIKKIQILKELINKLDDLNIELVVNDSEEKQSEEELENIMDEMSELINSVKDYT